ncbi:MAG: choice-of-anchor J domain-containing protein, partial [Ignavibacteria bacterium]|nr:choice-of-anchor J domain-containing protein [Ignavibacteria bacterium]
MKKTLLILTILALWISNSYSQNLSEGFEGASFPPTGWTRVNLGDAITWYRSTSGFRSGVACARIDYTATAHNDWLITPKLTPATGNSTISFWAKNQSTSYVERFNVLLSTTGTNTTDFTVTLASNIGPGTAYTQYTYNLSAYIGSNVYVAVQAISTDEYYLYLDDFSGPPIAVEACAQPTALSTSLITTTTATIAWTAPANAPANGYQWEVRSSGIGGSGATGLTASSSTAAGVTTANVTGLTAGQNYNLYVRSNCGTGFSDWAGPKAFATLCNAVTIFPYNEAFAAATIPQCWTQSYSGALTSDRWTVSLTANA